MNTESYIYNSKNSSNLAPIEDLNDRKIWEMQQKIELLQEQVKSLKQELTYSYELTNECLQEVEYAKQELKWMNEEIYNLINSKKLPMDEANPLASRMSEPKRVVQSTIDKFKAEFSNIRAESHHIIDHSIQLRAESQQIKVQSDKIQARSREIREHSCEVRERLDKKRVSQKLLKCKICSRLPFRAIANKRCSSEFHWLIGTGDNFHPFTITNKLEARFSRYLPDSLKTAIASLTPLAAKSDSLPVIHY